MMIMLVAMMLMVWLMLVMIMGSFRNLGNEKRFHPRQLFTYILHCHANGENETFLREQ
jgi:hypothetical protein